MKACSQGFIKNKYGNAWFQRLQKSTGKTFILKHFRNLILIGAANFKTVFHSVKIFQWTDFLELKILRGKI